MENQNWTKDKSELQDLLTNVIYSLCVEPSVYDILPDS